MAGEQQAKNRHHLQREPGKAKADPPREPVAPGGRRGSGGSIAPCSARDYGIFLVLGAAGPGSGWPGREHPGHRAAQQQAQRQLDAQSQQPAQTPGASRCRQQLLADGLVTMTTAQPQSSGMLWIALNARDNSFADSLRNADALSSTWAPRLLGASSIGDALGSRLRVAGGRFGGGGLLGCLRCRRHG